MEPLRKLLRLSAPCPLRGCVGACAGKPWCDELRRTSIVEYWEFLMSVDAAKLQKCGSAWQRAPGSHDVIWCSSIEFDIICCALCYASHLSKEDSADALLLAYTILQKAGSMCTTWEDYDTMVEEWPELHQRYICQQASLFLGLAHLKAIEGVTDLKLQAGLMQSLADYANTCVTAMPQQEEDATPEAEEEEEAEGPTQIGRRCKPEISAKMEIFGACTLALGMQLCAKQHFETGNLAGAVACADKALLDLRASQQTLTNGAEAAELVHRLAEDASKYRFVASRTQTRCSRPFTTDLLVPAIALPSIAAN